MNTNEKYIKHCLELAKRGLCRVAPNPMVGCLILHEGKVIGEGHHEEAGKAHAEVNAIESVKDKSLLKKSTLYVNLEPCSHHGKTPPCSDVIIEHKIPHIVIGSVDTNKLVSGKGIKKLIEAGCKIETGVLEKECREINKRFFTFHEKKRPYIILKWAQTKDKFIDRIRNVAEIGTQLKITSPETDKLVHKWRTEEQAILVGSNTTLLDNPQLTARLYEGKNPIRILIDRSLKIPDTHKIFNPSAKIIVFTSCFKKNITNAEYVLAEKEHSLLEQVLNSLFDRNIISVIVEGGGLLINHFIKENLWDEARVITNDTAVNEGVNAPEIKSISSHQLISGSDTINFYYNSR